MSKEYSVVVLTHNRPHYVSRLLESLKKQTLRPTCVIIVVNGVGRDVAVDLKYKALLSEHADLSIDLSFEDHLNIPLAFNFALSKVKTEWFAGISDDDLVLPDRFSRQLQQASDGIDAVVGSAVFIDEDDRPIVGSPIGGSGLGKGTGLDPFFALWLDNRIVGSTVLWRSEAVRSVGGMRGDLLVAHDFDLNLKIMKRGRCRYSDDRQTLYRVHGSNLTKKARNSTWIEIADIIIEQQKDPDSVFYELLEENPCLTLARVLNSPAGSLLNVARELKEKNEFTNRSQSRPEFSLPPHLERICEKTLSLSPIMAQYEALDFRVRFLSPLKRKLLGTSRKPFER